MSSNGESKLDKKISVVSRKYDVEHKGYLTDEQQMLRNLDTQGTGALTPEQLAPLMDSYKQLMKENAKNGRLIKILFAVVVLLGIGTIVASVLAANYAKDTDASSDGVLVRKGGYEAVITTSQGESASTIELMDPATGEYVQCMWIDKVAGLWVSFKRGTPTRMNINQTLSVDGGTDFGEINYSVRDLSSGTASQNQSEVVIGDVVFNVGKDNRCNRILGNYVEGSEGGDNRDLFRRHLAVADGRRANRGQRSRRLNQGGNCSGKGKNDKKGCGGEITTLPVDEPEIVICELPPPEGR